MINCVRNRKYYIKYLLIFMFAHFLPIFMLFHLKTEKPVDLMAFSSLYIATLIFLGISFVEFYKNREQDDYYQSALLAFYLFCIRFLGENYIAEIVYYKVAILALIIGVFNIFLCVTKMIRYWNI